MLFQEYKDVFFIICGSVCLLAYIGVGLIYKRFIDMFVAVPFILIFFLLLPTMIFGMISDKMDQRDATLSNGYSRNSSSTIQNVFEIVSIKSNFNNLNPLKSSLSLPDSWYDKEGNLKKNIKIEALSGKKLSMSFFALSEKECQSVMKAARMYGGAIEDDNSCENTRSVDIIFTIKDSNYY